MARRNKFNAVRTEVDGFTFDSKREAKDWQELLLLQKAGKISDLQRQVEFPLKVKKLLIATYRADFTFTDRMGFKPRFRVVDRKSPPTAKKRDFRIICKLMKACYGIDVDVWM
jgi:hypothetical protein